MNSSIIIFGVPPEKRELIKILRDAGFRKSEKEIQKQEVDIKKAPLLDSSISCSHGHIEQLKMKRVIS